MENSTGEKVDSKTWLQSRIRLCLTIGRVSFCALMIAVALFFILNGAGDSSGSNALKVFLYVVGTGFVLNVLYLLLLMGHGTLSLLEQSDKPSS